jgi:galactitol-specific phosphotransferase system IIB component
MPQIPLAVRPKLAVPTLAIGLLLGMVACGTAQNSPMSMPETTANLAQKNINQDSESVPSQQLNTEAVKPQLIKTANLRLSVRSIDQTVTKIRRVLKQEQGDIYDFNDTRGNKDNQRTVTLVIKVPEERLDQTIEAVRKFGNVIDIQIKSEDVTTQIVDTVARLKNLRQQEAMTQKIMERSGSIKDVLAVSKELAEVREQIERLDAQVKQLKGQVAFSTITLNLEAAVGGQSGQEDALGLQVQDTWNRSTRLASGVLRGTFLLGVGLVPFLPFLLVLGGGAYLVRRRIRLRR